jgi:methionine-gamma-lyase
MNQDDLSFESRLIHAGGHDDPLGSPIMPIYQSSTFKFKDADHGARCFSGESKGYIYTRIANPTIRELERTMANLEGGFDGIATSSGMGAVNTVYLAYLAQGAHVICAESVYGPSRVVLETIYPKFGVESTFVDTSDTGAVRKAFRANTRLLYTETPANPTMRISDLRALSELAHEHGVPLVVDNTFCSPYLQRPFEFGADVVLHSMTKFINGHADVVAGMIVTREEKDYRLLRNIMTSVGCNMDPHQAYLTRRGLKTLSIRIDRAQENAMKVATFLEQHPKVQWILYPGLKSHPQYELALQQMKGPGAMMSFGLKGGLESGKVMMNNVRLALLAVSLGGIETLIQHPASMTHSKMTREAKQAAGITDGLVRLSVGIEDAEDIITDLGQALEKV